MDFVLNIPQQLNNIAKNTESLARAQGIPGEAIEGLLQLDNKSGLHYNTPKSYRARDGASVDSTRVEKLSKLFGVSVEALLGGEAVAAPEVEPFGFRLASAVRRFMVTQNPEIKESRLPKVFGRGKGKGITKDDVRIVLSHDERLPEPHKLRLICRKLQVDWFAPEQCNKAPVQKAAEQEKLPLTVENVGKIIGEVVPDWELEKMFSFCRDSMALWAKCAMAQNIAELERMAQEEAPQPQAEIDIPLSVEGASPKKEVEKPMQRYSVSSQKDIQAATTTTRNFCGSSGLADYGFFALAGLPQSTGEINKMTRPAYWSEELVQRYAEILNATPEAIVGKTQWSGDRRNYGRIFAQNLNTALELRGANAEEIVSVLAKETDRYPANLRKQILQSNSLPSYVDACALMAITGLRLYDVLDWTGERVQQPTRKSELERQLEGIPKSDWIPAAAFQKNIKLLCEEAYLIPLNLFWLVGINDAKARATWGRMKKLPEVLVEACAKVFGLSAASLLSENPPRLPAGTDFAAMFKTRFDEACDDANLCLQDVAHLTDMSVRITTGKTTLISASTLDEKILSGEMLGKNNNVILSGLLCALQTTLNELIYPAKGKPKPTQEPCEWDFPSDTQGPKGSGPAESGKQKDSPVPKSEGPAAKPAAGPAPIPQPEEPEPEPEAETEEGPAPVVPPGVSGSVALRACFNTPVPGEDKQNVYRIVNRARAFDKSISFKLLRDILDGKAEPTAAQLDAFIKVFYPEACQDAESLEKSRKKFFAKGRAAIVTQTMVCDTEHWGMDPADAAVVAARIRMGMKKAQTTIGAVVNKLEQHSCMEGAEARFCNLAANMTPESAPGNEFFTALAAALKTTKAALIKMPEISKTLGTAQEENSDNVNGLHDPVKVQSLYYNMIRGGLLTPQFAG